MKQRGFFSMSFINRSYLSELKSFANENKLLTISTLGLAVIGYSMANLAGRTISWLSECLGITKKTSAVGHEAFKSISSRHKTDEDTTAELPVSKEVSSSLKTIESSSSFMIIDWQEANHQIRDQVQEMWPKRIKRFTEEPSEGDRIICIADGAKLVGCVALEPLTVTGPVSLVQQVGSQKVYALDIEIESENKGKGYGRAVFNNACSLVADEGASIFLTDMAAQGIGDRLYGGQKTLELFDVYFVLTGSRGEYLLRKKSQLANKLIYLKIDPTTVYIFFRAIESPEGMNHLMNYLETYPEDESLIDPSIISTCESIIEIYKDIWDEGQLMKYNEGLHRLRRALH